MSASTVRHAEVVAGIARRHRNVATRAFDKYEGPALRTFLRGNQLAINEGWKSLGTIIQLHREFDRALGRNV
jgi:hypothetical protein